MALSNGLVGAWKNAEVAKYLAGLKFECGGRGGRGGAARLKEPTSNLMTNREKSSNFRGAASNSGAPWVPRMEREGARAPRVP